MYTGPNIITNGLVLALDAANTKSYPGSGTSWNDLSGNNYSGTLVGSPTFNSNPNSFTFESNKNVVTTSSNSTTLSAATFITWINPSQTQNQYSGIIYSRSGYGGSTTNPIGLSFYLNNAVSYTWGDNPSTYNWNSGLSTPNNQWSMIVITVNSTAATAYLCQSSGITTATNTTNHSPISGLFNFYIACDPLSPSLRAVVGRIATSMVYNRALSASEIRQNYNATKSRFNL